LGRMIWLVAIRDGGSGRHSVKDVKPVCVKFTALLGRKLDYDVRERALCELYGDGWKSIEWVHGGTAKVGMEFSLSEPASSWLKAVAEQVSSMRTMSTELATPSGDLLSCTIN
jgi:hypothetical protein